MVDEKKTHSSSAPHRSYSKMTMSVSAFCVYTSPLLDASFLQHNRKETENEPNTGKYLENKLKVERKQSVHLYRMLSFQPLQLSHGLEPTFPYNIEE